MTLPTPTPTAARARPDSPDASGRARRIVGGGIVTALALSLSVHLGFSFWPVHGPAEIEPVPLAATITELPPPPAAVATVTPKPHARPKRAPIASAAEPVANVRPENPEPAAEPLIEPTPDAIAMGPELPAVLVETAAAPPATASPPSPDVLPPRVDLVYKGYLGTNGFEIGQATYRFEHDASEYRITTIGELRGLLALFFPGQAKLESSGTISAAGLQPHEFSLERGSKDRREVAQFDWETGIVSLYEQKTATLEIPTFDALSIMWQYYFSPPTEDEVTFSLATTRKVNRYTVTREGHEVIRWGQGEIDTVRWHHRSDDGRIEGYAWLAPSMHFIPVKMRYIGPRATVEGLLDSIRVDEPLARQ